MVVVEVVKCVVRGCGVGVVWCGCSEVEVVIVVEVGVDVFYGSLVRS